MSKRLSDLGISIAVCLIATFLSWPFWRDFQYWPESHAAWRIYFVVGFLLSVYVFYMFIGSLRILFVHETQRDETGKNAGDTP